PLTANETWTLYQPGEWSLWRRGECVAQGRT
ncbi:MAG: class II glutamine amidotransferase, partial [Pseudomonas sp.]